MSGAMSRLAALAAHLRPSSWSHSHHIHTLSPTFFLPRSAQIEPDAEAVYHVTANGEVLTRTYQQVADRARGLAYFLRSKRWLRVGILSPNTPGFLESIFGIGAAGGANVSVNIRLKEDDITYIFGHADVEAIIVDAEYVHLLESFCKQHPKVVILVDTDTNDDKDGPFNQAIAEGLRIDRELGLKGWEGLETSARDENSLIALAYTSGTTARPKGVEMTHRGAYLAAMANIVESGLNREEGRCRYLWTLPMFHAMGWTFPWAVTAVRGTHVCLRKIDYPMIWKLLKENNITNYNAAPTVNTLLCNAKEAERLPRPVRATIAGSAPTAHLLEQLSELNIQPVHVYGLTETYGPITKGYFLPEWEDLDRKDKYAKMARQGHGFVTSLPIRVIKTDVPYGTLVDVERDGKEIGEIVFVGNICAKGYYKDVEATKKLFAGGVLHSGDLAVWHADGSAQILDRAKDIIISGGENISSLALESMLATHPDILEAGVIAIPDEKWGECPKAYITVKQNASLQGEDIIAWARHQSSISKFMIPKEVEVVEELPKTSTGKLQKNVMRAWAKEGAEKRNSRN